MDNLPYLTRRIVIFIIARIEQLCYTKGVIIQFLLQKQAFGK